MTSYDSEMCSTRTEFYHSPGAKAPHRLSNFTTVTNRKKQVISLNLVIGSEKCITSMVGPEGLCKSVTTMILLFSVLMGPSHFN